MKKLSEIAVELVDAGNAHKYYYTPEWVHLQPDVMDKYRRECIRCKCIDRTYNRAHILHHVLRLKSKPEYADIPFLPATAADKEQANSSSIVFKQFYGDTVYTVICIDTVKFERYYVVELNSVIQLLPLCRDCHKIVHSGRIVKAGSLDERFPEILD